MTRRTRTKIVTTALGSALLLAVTACGSPSGPTAAQAGAGMRTDVTGALKVFHSLNTNNPPYTVSSDASKDVPCGKGKATRMFTAEQRRPWKGVPDPASMHDEVQSAATWFRQYEIDLDAKNDDGPDRVSYGLISEKRRHAHVEIVATRAPNVIIMTFNGRSDCLRTS